jgi:hypothetical protein
MAARAPSSHVRASSRQPFSTARSTSRGSSRSMPRLAHAAPLPSSQPLSRSVSRLAFWLVSSNTAAWLQPPALPSSHAWANRVCAFCLSSASWAAMASCMQPSAEPQGPSARAGETSRSDCGTSGGGLDALDAQEGVARNSRRAAALRHGDGEGIALRSADRGRGARVIGGGAPLWPLRRASARKSEPLAGRLGRLVQGEVALDAHLVERDVLGAHRTRSAW